MKAALALAATALLLAGCVTVPPLVQIDLTGRTCSAAPDISAPMALLYSDKEQTVDVPFTAADACVQTAKGPALYHVFQMPDAAPQMTFSVASTPIGGALFPLRVLLLDGNGAAKRDYAGDALTFRGNQLTALFRGHPDETYLVVEADPGVLGQSLSRTQESTSEYTGASGGLYFTVHTGSDSTSTYTFTQAGHVILTLAPTVPPKKE